MQRFHYRLDRAEQDAGATGICVHCGSQPGGKGTEFANVSGTYQRDL